MAASRVHASGGWGVVVVQIGTRGRGKAVDTGARRRAVVNKGWQHA
jgi:hypothetical protein